jgi:hypothetical protein
MEYKNWHNIIEEIESNIKNLAKGPKTPPNTVERLKFLSEAAKEFTYFKDGWRNHVSHNRMSYDASQAYSAISHVSAFMQHLSTQLKE